jgi:hypothetical protein
VIRPCSRPSIRLGIPARRPATQPPAPTAISVVTIHQIAAPMPKVVAPGMPPCCCGSTVVIPIPIPRRLKAS